MSRSPLFAEVVIAGVVVPHAFYRRWEVRRADGVEAVSFLRGYRGEALDTSAAESRADQRWLTIWHGRGARLREREENRGNRSADAMAKKLAAEEAGAAAYQRGFPSTACPHSKGSDRSPILAGAWRRGWRRERERELEARLPRNAPAQGGPLEQGGTGR